MYLPRPHLAMVLQNLDPVLLPLHRAVQLTMVVDEEVQQRGDHNIEGA